MPVVVERTIKPDVERAYTFALKERQALAEVQRSEAALHAAAAKRAAAKALHCKAASARADREHLNKSVAVINNMRTGLPRPEDRAPRYFHGATVGNRLADARTRMLENRLMAAEQRLTEFEHEGPQRAVALSAQVDTSPVRAAKPPPPPFDPEGKRRAHRIAVGHYSRQHMRQKLLSKAKAELQVLRDTPLGEKPLPKRLAAPTLDSKPPAQQHVQIAESKPARPASSPSGRPSVHAARQRIGMFGSSPRWPYALPGEANAGVFRTPLHFQSHPGFRDIVSLVHESHEVGGMMQRAPPGMPAPLHRVAPRPKWMVADLPTDRRY